jgi:hypothetical protein
MNKSTKRFFSENYYIVMLCLISVALGYAIAGLKNDKFGLTDSCDNKNISLPIIAAFDNNSTSFNKQSRQSDVTNQKPSMTELQ